jgi:hypothetical protein
MLFATGFAIGASAASVATFIYYRNLIDSAHLAKVTAETVLLRARNEYIKLKAGLAHKLDEILK